MNIYFVNLLRDTIRNLREDGKFSFHDKDWNLQLSGNGKNVTTGEGRDAITYLGSDGTFNTGSNKEVFLIDGSQDKKNGNSNNVSMGKGDDYFALLNGDENTIDLGDGNDIGSIGNAKSSGTDAEDNNINLGAGNDILWLQDGSDTHIIGGLGDDTIMLYGSQEDWEREVSKDGLISYRNTKYGTSFDFNSKDGVEYIGFTNGSEASNQWSFINAQDGNKTNKRPVTQTYEDTFNNDPDIQDLSQ